MPLVRRQRGIVLIIFVVVIIGGAFVGLVTQDHIAALKQVKSQQNNASRETLQNARSALLNYMLIRNNRPFNIARVGGNAIEPRLLMLPCPDNLSDHNLDGTQDPTCGANNANNTNLVNNILKSGSRFGRLPYKKQLPSKVASSSANENEIGDGLGRDFIDGHSNRLWYAVSQNMTPRNRNQPPLNLHRLATIKDKWLEVNTITANAPYEIVNVNKRVAAVILAPNKTKPGRLSEHFLLTASLNIKDIKPKIYFESIGDHSNSNTDGSFAQSIYQDEFNDMLTYVTVGELINPQGRFARQYRAYTGATQIQNAPLADSPLSGIYQAITRWKNVFGFYPTPAVNISAHIDNTSRHCAASRALATGSGTITNVKYLFPPNEIMLTTINIATTATTTLHIITLQNDSAFLTGSNATIMLTNSLNVEINDQRAIINTAITVARYARITLAAGVSLITQPEYIITTRSALSTGGAVSLIAGSSITVSFAKHTPLMPPAPQTGWLPEHYRTTMIISPDNRLFHFSVSLTTSFMFPTIITSSVHTLTITSADKLILPPIGKFKIEKDLKQLKFLYKNAVVQFSDGRRERIIASRNYLPTPKSFNKRAFVIPIITDILRKTAAGDIITQAPRVIYPWQDTKTTLIVNRDNLHPYPPCFDSRHLSRRVRTFIEDNNIYYAVAQGCDYGEFSHCPFNGGLTVSIAASVKIATPQTFALSNTYTATITLRTGVVRLKINNGEAMRALTVTHNVLLPIDSAANYQAEFKSGFTLTMGATVIIPAQTILRAKNDIVFNNVEAILIYSPAPLNNVQCAINAPPTVTAAITRQGNPDANLTRLCEWLDHDENANRDNLYFIPSDKNGHVASNDFFLLFGGKPILD